MFPHPDSLWYKTHKLQEEHRARTRAYSSKPVHIKTTFLKRFMLTAGNLLVRLGTHMQQQALSSQPQQRMAKSTGES